MRRVGVEWGERLLVVELYGWLVARLWAGLWHDGKLIHALLLASEGLVVALMLIRRRATVVSDRPGEWLVALGATCLPLLAHPGGEPFAPVVAAIVMLLGLVVQIHAKASLGRSIGMVPAHRGLRLVGPYRFVRHPMYAGYLLTHLAYLSANPTAWNLGVYAACIGLQVLRLRAEERLLGDDPEYAAYRDRVPYRLIPAVF